MRSDRGLTPPAEPVRQRRPYLGPKSYGLEDRDLFFGRGSQARVVSGMITAQPITVLTGASGTGKSSLLRAEVIPTLLAKGWCTIYAHPENDPVEALKTEIFAQGLPAAAEESRVLRLIGAAAKDSFLADTRLSQIEDWYARLDPGDGARAEIIAPPSDLKVPRIGLIAKVLAGLLTRQQALFQFQHVAAYGPRGAPDIAEDPAIGELGELLERVEAGRGRLAKLLERSTLHELVEALWSGWARGSYQGVVLILDQAEELYTTFGVAGAETPRLGTVAGKYPWQDRERLFGQVVNLAALARTRPLRFCFSLRPEHYADLRQSLDPVAPDERQGVYFLRRFTRQQGLDAVTGPVRRLGGEIDKLALAEALKAIGSEGQFDEIDPFLVAIVFDLAWKMAAHRGEVRITRDDFDAIRAGPNPASDGRPLSLAEGALRWLLQAPFEDLPRGDHYDLLELLRGLFSEEGKRRPAPEELLISRPLRDREHFRALLDRLEKEGLVRRFQRERRWFVDIRHERLIEPILARSRELAEADRAEGGAGEGQAYRSFLKTALDLVSAYDGAKLDLLITRGLDDDPLPDWARKALEANFETIAWDPPAARLMLASLLYSGPAVGGEDETRRWRRMTGDLLRLAGTRLSAVRVGDRAALSRLLERGARLDRASAEAWLEGSRRIPREIRARLWVSKLTAPQESEG